MGSRIRQAAYATTVSIALFIIPVTAFVQTLATGRSLFASTSVAAVFIAIQGGGLFYLGTRVVIDGEDRYMGVHLATQAYLVVLYIALAWLLLAFAGGFILPLPF